MLDNLKSLSLKAKNIIKENIVIALETVLEKIDPQQPHEESTPKECTRGSLAFTMAGKWIDGTTLRDMMAGSTALAATWASVGEETAPLDRNIMTKGPYVIQVHVDVTFEPLDSSEYEGPIYNGAALVQHLQMKHGKRPVIN